MIYSIFLALLFLYLRQLFICHKLKQTLRQYQIGDAFLRERERQNNRQRL